MKANNGFTLIELAVVLAVIAILAALLTPLVTSYIDEARVTRAASDARAIAQAYRLHQRDTGKYPIFETNTNTTAAQDYLVGEGTAPSTASWTALGTTGLIDEYLNENKLGLDSSGNFRGGRVAYGGPYLQEIPADPWGNPYVINAEDLEDGATDVGFVISAGPNGVLDTTFDQTGDFDPAEDDIVVRIE